jgi:hypothetical protein
VQLLSDADENRGVPIESGRTRTGFVVHDDQACYHSVMHGSFFVLCMADRLLVYVQQRLRLGHPDDCERHVRQYGRLARGDCG